MEYEDRLGAMTDWSKKAEPKPPVPDGGYEMQITGCTIEESQNSGRLQICRNFLIISGPENSESVRDYMQLETEQGPRYVNDFFETLGYPAFRNAKEIGAICDHIELKNPIVVGKVKTNKQGFTNIRVARITGEKPDYKPMFGDNNVAPVPEEVEAQIDPPVTANESQPESDAKVAQPPKAKAKAKSVAVTQDALRAFCATYQIAIRDDWDDEAISKELREYEWSVANDTISPENAELLKAVGANVKA